MSNNNIREAIESCRAGHDDLAQPELADASHQVASAAEWREALVNIQRVDGAIVAALHDVAVPMGLESRLLAAIDTAERSSCDGSPPGAAQASAAAISTPASPITSAERRTTRRWLLALAMTAASLALVVWGVAQWRRTPVIVAENLGLEALTWVHHLPELSDDMAEAPRQLRPLDRQLRVAPHGWQLLATPYDNQTAVYDVSRQRGKAFLFVIAVPHGSAALTSTATRVPATGGWEAAVWQRAELVYVLIIEQRRQKLDDYLARPSSEVVRTGTSGLNALALR